MAEKLAEAKLVLSLDDKALQSALAKLPGQAEKVAADVEKVKFFAGLVAFKEIGSAVFSGLKSIGDGLVELGNRGAQVDDVASSFEALTSKTGETADMMLGKLREGVVGTLSDYDLMTLANKTLGSGLVKTSADMGVLAAGARTLAKATGETTKEAFDTLTSAMASGRTASLKQLGLFVDSKVAVEQYAQSIGKNVAQLTDQERAQALSAASLAALRVRMQEIAPDAADFGELIDQAKVRLENFKDQIAVGIAKSPAFSAGMAAMGRAMDTAFGINTNTVVAGLVGLMEGLAIGVLNVGHGAVGVGKVFATVFAAVETIINGVLTAVVAGAGGIVTMIDTMARLAAALPFASDAQKELAATTGNMKLRVDAMTQSLAASTAEAARGVVGQGALHEKLNALSGGLFTVQYSMDLATAATNSTTDATNKQGEAATVAAAKNQDMATKVAQAFRDLNNEIWAGTKVGLEKRLFEIDAARVKELEGLKAFKFESDLQHDQMEALIEEKYRQRVAAALLAGDEIKAKEQQIQNDIALLSTTGTANKMLQIQIARDAEIASLEYLRANNAAQHAALVAAVIEKYRLQTAAAQGYYATIELAAAASGFKTRAELQKEADNAKRLYEEMLASGLFTYQQLEAAKKNATDAETELDDEKTNNAKENFLKIAEAASSMLRDLFGKSKAAAIAAVLIDAAAAIVKGWAQGGIMGWVNAGVIAAATAKQISTIRSQKADGFAKGTPGLDFHNFGAESWQPLHNQEAVIPRGGGHVLAGEIASSMPGQDEQLSLIRRLVDLAERAPAENRKAFRNAMILDLA